ncbi:MAG: DMT family transporter [Desulfurococcaceae archaeon]
MSRISPRFINLLLLPLIWLSISSSSIFVVISRAPGEICAFWRLAFTLLILLPLWMRSRGPIRIYHVISGVSLAMHFICWMQSLFLIPVYTSTLLVSTYPIYALFIDMYFHKYRPTIMHIIGLMGTFASLAIFLDVNQLFFDTGTLLALLGGVFGAIYFELGSYARQRLGENTVSYSFPTYLIAMVSSLIYNLIFSNDLLHYPPYTFLCFLLMALIPMMLGHTMINYLLRSFRASVITALLLGEPFGSGLLAHVFLDQSLTLLNILIGLCIMFFIGLILFGKDRDHV